MGLTLASLWVVGECLYLPGPQLPQLHKASESIFPVETVLGTDWVAIGVLGLGSGEAGGKSQVSDETELASSFTSNPSELCGFGKRSQTAMIASCWRYIHFGVTCSSRLIP